jgi:putative transposase
MPTLQKKQEPTGHWFICFVSHFEIPDVEPVSCDNPVGMDMGLDNFVTLSTGEKVKAPRFHRKKQAKLRRDQRKVSRRFDKGKRDRHEPQSQNYQKARKKVACTHARIKRQRDDFLHKLSLRIVKSHDVIIIEDLDMASLAKTKLRGHAKSWYDAAASAFRRMLDYKAQWHNKRLVKVDRWFPSSKRCSHCGAIHQALTLSDREWKCAECGTIHDRDLNSSHNLLQEGLRLLALPSAPAGPDRKDIRQVNVCGGSRRLFDRRAASEEAENSHCEVGSPSL